GGADMPSARDSASPVTAYLRILHLPPSPPTIVWAESWHVGRNAGGGNPVLQRAGWSSHRRSHASASSPSALPTPCPLSRVRTKRKRSGTPARAYARSRTRAVDSAHAL